MVYPKNDVAQNNNDNNTRNTNDRNEKKNKRYDGRRYERWYDNNHCGGFSGQAQYFRNRENRPRRLIQCYKCLKKGIDILSVHTRIELTINSIQVVVSAITLWRISTPCLKRSIIRKTLMSCLV